MIKKIYINKRITSVLEGLGWLKGSSMGVCEALCDMRVKRDRPIQINLICLFVCCLHVSILVLGERSVGARLMM